MIYMSNLDLFISTLKNMGINYTCRSIVYLGHEHTTITFLDNNLTIVKLYFTDGARVRV
jgi:hypothetical protein